ncbi:MAG: glycosyltransferase family 39 protein [Gammaproteobacteria bacterium]|nr:glycosyltransferase family 39 protein [Gammaproteobacteria bacterium]
MSNLKLTLRDEKYTLISLFLLALFIRLAFSFYFQQFYFGDFTYKYKDTSTYLLPILNLFEHGVYQGDMYLEDSKYFRVPVYPTFLGLVHLIFGATNFDHIVAFFQSLLDSISTVLVFLIIYKISLSKSASLISALIYASYPFVILWTPISYPETIHIFLMWLLITHLIYAPSSTTSWITRGVLFGLLILTKQYMGVMIIVIMGHLVSTHSKEKWTYALIALTVGITIILSPWTIRNYIQSGELIVLRGETIGMRAYGKDFDSFRKFAKLFNENLTPIVYEIVYQGTITLTKHPEFVERHRGEIDTAVMLAHKCGDSFVQRRLWLPESVPPYHGCADTVVEKFDYLTKAFWDEVHFSDAIETRLNSFTKIFTKEDVVNKNLKISNSGILKSILLKYRVLILICGIFGLLLIIRQSIKSPALSIFATAGVLYTYFTFVIVHAEMRYLLIPDLLITIFSGVAILKVYTYLKNTIFSKKRPIHEAIEN